MQMQEDVAPPPPSHIRWMKFLSVLQLLIIGPAGKKRTGERSMCLCVCGGGGGGRRSFS
jgi:hypothetical protein